MKPILIYRATKDQSDAIAILVGELLQGIMDRIGIDVFHLMQLYRFTNEKGLR
jgi:hypothetical protein